MADPVVTTGAVALGAFLLATARDEYARNRDGRQKDRAVLTAVAEELEANLRIARNNREIIHTELAALAGGRKRVLNPLDPLEIGFWDLVKLQRPKGLLQDTAALTAVREVARLAGQVNQMLQSREAFRIASSGPSLGGSTGVPSWVLTLRGYDELIDRFLGELLATLEKAEPAVAAWRRHT